MKNSNTSILKMNYRNLSSLQITLLLIVWFLFSTTVAQAQTICNNDTGSHGGFTYSYWKSRGNGCMELTPGGGFSIEWNNVGNLLARKARRPGSFEQIVTYDVDFRPDTSGGRSFVSIYGWTQNPLVEYYIVEAWSHSRPTKGTRLGTIYSDGSEYDLYRTERVNKPSIEGTKTFYQYWSIRRTERTSGTVTTANHFKGWRDIGLELGSLWEVSLVIEALRDSAGFADVKSMSMTAGTSIIGPEGYNYAANETETVQIADIPYDVAYGQDGQYEYLTEQRNSITCDNDTFGNDPLPGTAKYCFTRESKVPYLENTVQIPGIIEAEHYDFGGPGRSYLDDDSENRGDVGFREESGVDIDKGPGGIGYAVGWMATGEWLEYTVAVSQAGTYNFNFNTSSPTGAGVLRLDVDGQPLLTGIPIPETGDWDSYSSFAVSAALSEGIHVLRFNVEQSGFNLDKIEISNDVLSVHNFDKSVLQIFPNPVNEKLHVSGLPEDNMQIIINDPLGKTVHAAKLSKTANQLTISHLRSGLYFITFVQNRGAVVQKSFVKK